MPVAELGDEGEAVLAVCGGLPLALSVVGALLRGTDRELWQDTIRLLRKADLSAIEAQLPPGQESFFRAVEVSYQALKPSMQERYRELAVLVEDMSSALPVLRTLWGGDEAEARRICGHFVDRSLALPEGEGIRLHELQLDYVRALWPDKDALALIHGAARLSAHVVAKDPRQFASQMVGRLLAHDGLCRFAERVAERAPRPWIHPLWPTLHPPGTTLLRTLEGHSTLVHRVAVSPDGLHLISASFDHTLKLWDLETGRELRTLSGHSESVEDVAVSPDGRRAVSASRDFTLKVWDLETGRELRTLERHSHFVSGVAVSPDGRRAVSASDDKMLKVWELDTENHLATFTADAAFLCCVFASADAIVAGDALGEVHYLRLEDRP